MKRLLVLSAIAILAGCNSNEPKTEIDQPKTDTMATANPAPAELPNALSPAEQQEGWLLLFDGNTKNGWHVYNKKSDGSAWKAVDGTLFFDPSQKEGNKVVGGGDIVTDEEFSNFHLKLDWKISPKGNSGIMIYVKEDPKYQHTYHTGPEMQVLDDAGHPDAKIAKHTSADLYDLISASPEMTKPAGEWNQVDIISNNGALEFHMNATKVLSVTMWDDNWKKMIAASKFKQWPDFGTYKTGRIALQDHGDQVWYRNIKVRKL